MLLKIQINMKRYFSRNICFTILFLFILSGFNAFAQEEVQIGTSKSDLNLSERNEKYILLLKGLRGFKYEMLKYNSIPLIFEDEFMRGLNKPFVDKIREKNSEENGVIFFDHAGYVDSVEIPFYELGDLNLDVLMETISLKLFEGHTLASVDKGIEINIPFLTLHLSENEESFELLMWNWVENREVFRKTIKISEINLDEAVDSLISEASAFWKTYDFNGAVASLAALTQAEDTKLKEMRVFQFYEGKARDLSGNQKAARRQFKNLSNDFNIYVRARKADQDIDRGNQMHMFAGIDLELRLDRKGLRQVDFGPLEIKGPVDYIEIQVKNKKTMKKYQYLVENQENAGQVYFDKYGNAIFTNIGVQISTGKELFLGFIVVPGYNLDMDSHANNSDYSIHGVDFSKYGLEDIPYFFSYRLFQPLLEASPEKPYYLFSFIKEGQLGKFGPIFEKAVKTAFDVEKWLSFEPGTCVKAFIYIPSLQSNACVSFGNPAVVYIWDEIADTINQGGEFILAHEMFHVLDFQYGISNFEEFKDLFVKIKKSSDDAFFNALAEKNFLEAGMGGHPQDDKYEFFASLMSSLFFRNWQQSVDKLDERILGLYYYSLLALKKAFEAKLPQVLASEFYQELSDKLLILEKKKTYPHLEDLMQIPASQLLSQDPYSVKMIEVWDFEKLVVKADKLSILLVLEDKNRNVVELYKEIAQKVSGKIDIYAMYYRDFSNLINSNMEYLSMMNFSLSSPSMNIFHDKKLYYSTSRGPGISIFDKGIQEEYLKVLDYLNSFVDEQ
ncbi:MAG: hypothetical protein ABIA04_04130 [Pseudomonadota bacterium]